MEPGVLHLRGQKVKEIDEILDFEFLGLALIYAKEYEKNGRNFINCFMKFPSIRSACAWIVQTSKHDGSFKEAQETGKNFSEWTSKLKMPEEWKRVLAETLLILYSIIQPSTAPTVDVKEV